MSKFTSEYQGSIFLDRRIIETEWFTGCAPSAVCLMIYLLFAANYKETVWHGIKLQRGEYIGSIGNEEHPGRLMIDTNLPRRTLRDALERLKGLGEIEVVTKTGYHGYTLIKIVNYDLYTCADKKAAQKPAENTAQKATKKAAHSKEVEEVNNEEGYCDFTGIDE